VKGNKPPISIVVLACVYIAVGAAGFVYHFRDSIASPRGGFWIELVEVIAVVSGIFMIAGRNWARWLALAWIAFHVVLSFGAWRQLAVHTLFCAVIAWILLRPVAARYFRGVRVESEL
jgi:hypothetical protein